MKILLFGEYSNVHWTLAQGLRSLGHDVTVVSDGDGWKNYPRDISLTRESSSHLDGIRYYLKALRCVSRMRGYDVVQIINPEFLLLRPERIMPFYKRLRRQNKLVIMGAFGMDYYWVHAGIDCKTFRYSDFNIGANLRKNSDNDKFLRLWYTGEKGTLTRKIAQDCDGIVAGLYEYYASYVPHFPEKLTFIPFPIVPKKANGSLKANAGKIKFFIGIQKLRSVYKGTDIMLRALLRVAERYPERCTVERAESLPFEEYRKRFLNSDVLLDQLYSYTPAMNGLEAMSYGIVLVGGGEPENYEILGEDSLRPIINVLPDEEDVFEKLCDLVEHPERLPKLSADSRKYIERHHDYKKVAQRYVDFYRERMQAKGVALPDFE